MTISTRFGATPEHKNTFYNYQGSDVLNPMSVTSAYRFSKGLLATTKFQVDEKKIKESRDLAKLENIRKYQKSLIDRTQNEMAKSLEIENNKLKTMGLAQWSYEHVKNLIL